MNNLEIILSIGISFLITLASIPVIINIAKKKKLYDIPDKRKLHKDPISSLGGIGIFIGFIISTLLLVRFHVTPEFQYIVASIFIVFFLGVKDDLVALSATKKLIGQLIAASILVHLANIKLESMYGFMGIYTLPDTLSLAITYATYIVIINAINLIDGVDGLAGSLGLLTTTILGSYFLINGELSFALMAFSVAGSLCAFLIFNYQPAKIFMGDSGSLVLGLVNAILVIKFINFNHTPGIVFSVSSSVAIAIALLIVPLVDTLRVFVVRIFKGSSPFNPDKNHFHHLLLERGLNHRQIAIACTIINFLFIAFAFLFQSLGSNILFLIMLVTSFIGLGWLYYYHRPPHDSISDEIIFISPKEAKSTTKVVSINADNIAVKQH